MFDVFIKGNFGVIKLVIIGGFLKVGNIIFIIGIEDECVEDVLVIIKENCKVCE